MLSKFKLNNKHLPFYPLYDNPENLIYSQEDGSVYQDFNKFIATPENRGVFIDIADKLLFGDCDTIRITSFFFSGGTLTVNYMPSRYSIYKGFSQINHGASHGEGLDVGRVGERLLSNHCGTGLFIDCKRGGEGDDADDRVLIGMRPNSKIIDTHRLFRTYSASGSIDLTDGSPFDAIMRETLEELNYSIVMANTELVSFGYDCQLGYFQFSFFHRSNLTFFEIVEMARGARDNNEYTSLDAITYSGTKAERALDEISEIPWEPSALYSLIILYSRIFTYEKMDWFIEELENKLIAYNDENNYKIFD